MEEYPLVSVITINFNGLKDTKELLESLKDIDYPNIEIILTDNGSDQKPDGLQKEFPKLILIKNDKNLGFAAANNIGIKQANGKYILIINNDVIVKPDFLEPLMLSLKRNKNIGIVSPKIYYHHSPQTIQYAGFTNINSISIRNKSIGFNEPETGKYDEERETFYAHGAAFLFKSELIKKVGMMSEVFFLYYEEMDWCKQVRDQGYQINYVPQSVVYHKDSATTGTNSPFKTYYLNRGRLIYMLRNVKYPLLILSTLYQIFFAFPKNLMALLIQKKRDHARAYRNAFGWFIKHFLDKKVKADS